MMKNNLFLYILIAAINIIAAYSQTQTLTYQYDGLNRLTSISMSGNTPISFSYDEVSNRTNVMAVCVNEKIVSISLYQQGMWNGTIEKPAPFTVELRQGDTLMTSAVISRKSALIDSSGYIMVNFDSVSDGSYWLVVRSAGYMPLAIPQQITLPACNGITYNFTTSSSQAVGTNRAMIQSGNYWLMRAGDFNSSRNVNTVDFNILLQNNGKSLSGQVPPP